MQNKDLHRFNIGLNKDDNPADIQPGEYTDALNMRVASSDEQQGIGIMETLQGEVELIIDAIIPGYYGGAIGGRFIYEGYEGIQIGTQLWMKKNYAANYPGSRVYGNQESNRDIYGGLYTWDMVQNPDFCPEGWRVPTEADWNELIAHLGGDAVAGGKMKEAGGVHWLTPNVDANDLSGFSGFGGGKYSSLFELLLSKGMYWIYDDIEPVLDIDIVLTTTHSGYLSLSLAGDGFVYIDWGDGVVEVYHLDNSPLNLSHNYPLGGTVTIYDCSHVTSLIASGQSITDAVVSDNCTELEHLDLSDNLLTIFSTHPEWDLTYLDLSDNQLLNVPLYTWGFSSLTEPCYLYLDHNLLGSISIPASWAGMLGEADISYNNINSLILTNLSNFSVVNISHNNISVISLPVGIVYWTTLYANDNAIAAFQLNATDASRLEILALQNNSIIAFALPANLPNLRIVDATGGNQINSFTANGTWGILHAGSRNYNFYANNLSILTINTALTAFDLVVGTGAWRLGDRVDFSGIGNAIADGSALAARANLIVQQAIVLVNLPDYAAIIALFDYLWVGQIIADTLVSETDGRVITVIGKDFATNFIPYASVATFTLVADADFIADDMDNLWFTGVIANNLNVGDLADHEYHRTLVKITDEPPYEITAIGILKSGVTLTLTQINELADLFLLSIFWNDIP